MPTPTSDDLLARQDRLQDEAAALRSELGLDGVLGAIGRPVVVGSAALGLMVWRDLDITVVCDRLDLEAILDVARRIGLLHGVRRVEMRNETGRWNADPAYPDGVYLGIDCISGGGDRWNIDIWFVDQPDRQPDLAHIGSMPAMLDDGTRGAILSIKAAWCDRPGYGSEVTSHQIYRAVLDHGVRTIEQFEAHRRSGT